MTWDDCAAELDALLVWWSVERRSVAGARRFRITGRVPIDDKLVQVQSMPNETLAQLIHRLKERLRQREERVRRSTGRAS